MLPTLNKNYLLTYKSGHDLVLSVKVDMCIYIFSLAYNTCRLSSGYTTFYWVNFFFFSYSFRQTIVFTSNIQCSHFKT
jgi:hypothetical protein